MTAFAHQHDDPRGLRERIEAQLRQRIEEAVEMAGLEFLVAQRKKQGRPAPEEHSVTDRREFEALVADLLASLRNSFRAEIAEQDLTALDLAEAAAGDAQAQAVAGQVFLARRLPDYWQRFESHRAAYAQARLSEPVASGSWLRRLFSA
ncbi:MAG: hypothetical protein HYV93_20130 [Candidatus Rokubacteria bacterium]|nr:hypothetical protein [Candidatus Rokubacteria bacterium]